MLAAGYLLNEHRDYLSSIEQRLRDWGLASEFTYAGAPDREGKIARLREMDVFSMPAIYAEPKGLSLLEAMANGVPIVQPRRGAFTEIIERTGGGVLVPPDDPVALADALHALLLDRVESDLDRLDRINRILLAGCRRYGPEFLDELNREMGAPPGKASLRPLETVLVRSSADIGRLAAEFVRSPEFRRRAPPLLGRVLLRLAEGEPHSEADFLSYLLFDGEFARLLIELGRADARARHDELCRFFADA